MGNKTAAVPSMTLLVLEAYDNHDVDNAIMGTLIVTHTCDRNKLEEAFRKVARAFVKTPMAREYMDHEGIDNLNWGDLLNNVPASMLETHGIVSVEEIQHLGVDFDSYLA